MSNLNSFPVVQLTLYLLGLFSVATWALIFVKAVQHTRSGRANRKFSKAFWAAPNLAAAAELEGVDGALARVADSGFRALRAPATINQHDDLEHGWDRHELLERNLRQQIKRERRTLDTGTAVLASIGSTAPFVGLFGTVWGIMHAMSDISRIGNASIDVVAGPIGEALIATGIGIAVAIPAVLAYNFFVRRLKAVIADLDDFANDFLNLAQRATYRVSHAGVRPVEVRPDLRARGGGKRDTVQPLTLNKAEIG